MLCSRADDCFSIFYKDAEHVSRAMLGDLLVDWDNHSSLNVVWGVDVVRKVMPIMTDTIRAQILAIRDTGRTNMFDVSAVQRLAYEYEFYDLVCYLAEHRKEYAHFIMTGEAE